MSKSSTKNKHGRKGNKKAVRKLVHKAYAQGGPSEQELKSQGYAVGYTDAAVKADHQYGEFLTSLLEMSKAKDIHATIRGFFKEMAK